MRRCLLCQLDKPNRAFASDRISCRKCLARWTPPLGHEYADYLGYARHEGQSPLTDGRRLDDDESESIALVSVARALKTFDPTHPNGMTQGDYIKLCIRNDIANERRLLERQMISWAALKMKTKDEHSEKLVEVGPEAITVDGGIPHERNRHHVHAGRPLFVGSYAYSSKLIDEINAWLATTEAREIVQKFLVVSVSESGPRNNERRERRFLDALTIPWLKDLFDGRGITDKIKQRQAKRKFLRLVRDGELILPSRPCTDRRCHCGYCEHDPLERAAMLRQRYFYESPHDGEIFRDLRLAS